MLHQDSFTRRLNETAHEALAWILLELADPRLRFITLTGVDVSRDRRQARVFITTSVADRNEALLALENARGRIRSLLAERLGWRVTPDLRFEFDFSQDEAERITAALRARPQSLDIQKDEEGYPLDAN